MSALPALLERVRAATGPDRKLDGALKIAGAAWVINKTDASNEEVISTFGLLYDDPRPYTASIDAAVSLGRRAIPGWDWSVQDCGEDEASASWWNHGRHEKTVVYGSAATPPLAILAALLSALIAQESAK